MKGGQTVINLKSGLAKIIGFICGYLFSSEVISAISYASNYTKQQMPTLFDVFAQWNSTVALILMALLIIFLIKIIMKFELMNFITWILLGALAGILIPHVMPYIADRLAQDGIKLPNWMTKEA